MENQISARRLIILKDQLNTSVLFNTKMENPSGSNGKDNLINLNEVKPPGEDESVEIKSNGSGLLKKFGWGIAIGSGVVSATCVGATIIGFGTAGIVAGSIAASTQSAIGMVAQGSLFAKLTSLGMCGYFSTGAVVGGVGAVTGTGLIVTDTLKQEDNSIKKE